MNPTEELNGFFDFMWGQKDGFVYLPTKDAEGNWKKVFYQWPEHRKFVVQHVLSATARRDNVFFSPALFSKPEAKKEFVLGSNVVWAEFDGNAPSEWPNGDHAQEATGADFSHVDLDQVDDTRNMIQSPETGTSGQSRAVGPPSVRVQSSTEDHQHIYWKLDEFCTDIAFIENTNRGLAYTYAADTSGWDANQILRPPCTTNYKHNLPVFVIETGGPTYKQNDFTLFKPIKQLVDAAVDESALPDVIDVVAKYEWDPDTLELIKKSAQDLGGRDRSSALMRVGYFCAEKGMSDTEAYALLLMLDNKWGKFKGREDRKHRLLDIINKAKTKIPHAIDESTEFAGLLGTTKIEVSPRVVFGFEEILALQEKIEWTVKGLIVKGGVGVIASAPGIGKTQVSLNLGIHSALSQPFVGLVPMYRQKILYLSLEMGKAKIKEFLSTMRPAFTDEQVQILQRNFMVAPIGGNIPLHSPEGRAFFESLIEEYRPDGVYVDSLQKVLLHDLKDDEQVRMLFHYFQAICNKYGIYIVFIHHNRKGQVGNKKPVELSDVYGSQFITSEPDWVITLWSDRGVDKNVIEVYNPKNRMAEMLDTFTIKRVENIQFQLDLGGMSGAKLLEGPPLGTGPASKLGI